MMQRRTLVNLMALSAVLLKTQMASATTFFEQGRPANVVLLTGGDYDRYRRILLAFAQGLHALDLIERVPSDLPLDRKETRDVWDRLATSAGGNRLRFLKDGHYNYEFTPEKRQPVLESLLKRIREKQDVDLILVFGTETSLDIAKHIKDIPIMSLSSTDPVTTGVVASAEDSGQDNLHALVTKDYFRRQVDNLLAIRHCQHLGFITAEQRVGKSGLGEIRAACEELGVTFHGKTYVEAEGNEEAKKFPGFMTALLSLLDEGVDVVIFPWFPCTEEQFDEVLALLVKRGVWSYAIGGPQFVAHGFLLGVGEENFTSYGLFEADVLRRILDNELPREISQVFVQQNRLSLNLRTAMQMGWRVPFGLLVSVEEVYTTQS